MKQSMIDKQLDFINSQSNTIWFSQQEKARQFSSANQVVAEDIETLKFFSETLTSVASDLASIIRNSKTQRNQMFFSENPNGSGAVRGKIQDGDISRVRESGIFD